MHSYTLQVTIDDNYFSAILSKRAFKKAGEATQKQPSPVGKIEARHFILIKRIIEQMLAKNNYGQISFHVKSTEKVREYEIDEESGVLLTLLMGILKPLSDVDRIAKIVNRVSALSTEEVNYFTSLAADTRLNALPALRILFG